MRLSSAAAESTAATGREAVITWPDAVILLIIITIIIIIIIINRSYRSYR